MPLPAIKAKFPILIIIVFLSLTSCITLPTQEEIDSIGFGEPITIDYEKAIKERFEMRLFDFFSAKFKFEEPTQYWIKDFSGQLYVGYGVPIYINAKNRFGAYTGWKKYVVLFRNNIIVAEQDFSQDSMPRFRSRFY